jgi:hypothetical protein
MNKIVREHYPVENLPDDLQLELSETLTVRITLEPEVDSDAHVTARIEELFELCKKAPIATDDPAARIRLLRDEWNV